MYAGCERSTRSRPRCRPRPGTLWCRIAYVQPHSGIDANLVAYWAILAHRVEQPVLERGRGAPRQRPGPEGWGAAPRRAGRPAHAGPGPRRRRPSHPRVPAQHLGEDVRPRAATAWTQTPGCSTTTPSRPGPGVPPADPRGRLLAPIRGTSTSPACARSPTRSGPRSWSTWPTSPGWWPARSSAASSTRSLRRRRDHHDPQVTAGTSGGMVLCTTRIRPLRGPGLSDGAGRTACPRDGGQGGGLGRGPTGRSSPTTPGPIVTTPEPWLRAARRGVRWSPAGPTTTWSSSTSPPALVSPAAKPEPPCSTPE